MAVSVETGLLALPNEVLLSIFSLFASKELLTLARTCRQIHSLVIRLLCHRLNVATALGSYTLYLECCHPAAKVAAERLFCTTLGTDGLQELSDRTSEESQRANQLGQLQRLYTRFRPQRREPDLTWRRPGDVPGSRTYASPARTSAQEPDEVVMETVTVDANDLWAQLTTVAFLGPRELYKELLWSKHTVAKGTVRVWRDWLSKNCESRTFSDHTTVNIQDDSSTSASSAGGITQRSSADPLKDNGLLWLNTRDNSLALRLKVKSKIRRMAPAALMYQSDLEAPVSYIVHFEEILIRTWSLLEKMEEAQQQAANDSERAIILRSYSTDIP